MLQVPARNHKKDVFYEVLCYTIVSDESHKKRNAKKGILIGECLTTVRFFCNNFYDLI